MRKLKKLFAVAATAAMTLAMSVSAFADQTITFHFQNAKNWNPVGAWIYQGVGFDVNVTNAFVTNTKADGSVKQLWPGAKCTDEGNGWVSVSATFSDTVATDGAVVIFNNFVADSKTNDTTEEDDIEAIKNSGIATDATATKEQTPNITLNKKNAFKDGAVPAEVWVTYDGKTATVLAAAPDSYAPASTNPGPTTTGNTETPTPAGSNTAASTPAASTPAASTPAASTPAASTPTSAGTGTASNTTAPKTGDTVAVSVIALAAVAAVAVVATKKKANA